MEFFDFELRAWQADATHAEVLVHSSPAGDMREPVKVAFNARHLCTIHQLFDDRWTAMPARDWPRLISAGQELADVLLPLRVHELLIRSLEHIPTKDGLRLRLCLDAELMDYPWEYLYRRDAPSDEPRLGFLALDPRVSLVREAPRSVLQPRAVDRKQRLLFAGTPFVVRGADLWSVDEERQQLVRDLQPVSDLLAIDPIMGGYNHFETALSQPQIDIFHYSGHTDIEDGQAFLLEDFRVDAPAEPGGYQVWQRPGYKEQYGVDRLYLAPMYSEKLGRLLRAAETQLAVFSACNSGHWAFVEPLLRAGVPVVLGTQGRISVPAALAFCHKLYSSVALGLSLDEAITWARSHLLEPGVLPTTCQWEWGSFIVYMATAEAVLFPKAEEAVRQRQALARGEREQTAIKVYLTVGTVGPGASLIGVSLNQPSKP